MLLRVWVRLSVEHPVDYYKLLHCQSLISKRFCENQLQFTTQLISMNSEMKYTVDTFITNFQFLQPTTQQDNNNNSSIRTSTSLQDQMPAILTILTNFINNNFNNFNIHDTVLYIHNL